MRRNFNPYYGAAFFFGIIFSLAAVAQTGTDSVAVNSLGTLIPSNWKPVIFLGLGIYELVVRFFPTIKNYSITGWLIKVYQTVLPNKNAKTPTDPHP